MHTLIYPFTGPSSNHCPENGLCHLRAMECPKVYIILPQVVALLFYANEYSLTANEHYEQIPTVSTTVWLHHLDKQNNWRKSYIKTTQGCCVLF